MGGSIAITRCSTTRCPHRANPVFSFPVRLPHSKPSLPARSLTRHRVAQPCPFSRLFHIRNYRKRRPHRSYRHGLTRPSRRHAISTAVHGNGTPSRARNSPPSRQAVHRHFPASPRRRTASFDPNRRGTCIISHANSRHFSGRPPLVHRSFHHISPDSLRSLTRRK